MPTLNRLISVRGPRFYLDGDEVMFVNHLDGSTREGPRAATEEDRRSFPEAYAAMGEDGVGRPLVSFSEPEGGKPAPAPKPYAERRARAAS